MRKRNYGWLNIGKYSLFPLKFPIRMFPKSVICAKTETFWYFLMGPREGFILSAIYEPNHLKLEIKSNSLVLEYNSILNCRVDMNHNSAGTAAAEGYNSHVKILSFNRLWTKPFRNLKSKAIVWHSSIIQY